MEETPVYVASRRHNVDKVKELNEFAHQHVPDDITHVLIDGNKEESQNTLEMQNEVGREISKHIQSSEKLLETSNIIYFKGDATSIDQFDGLDVIFTGNSRVRDVILENVSILGKKNVVVVTKGISLARILADEGINFMFYNVFISNGMSTDFNGTGNDAHSGFGDGHVDDHGDDEQGQGQGQGNGQGQGQGNGQGQGQGNGQGQGHGHGHGHGHGRNNRKRRRTLFDKLFSFWHKK